MMPGSPPSRHPPEASGPGNEAQLRALRVLIEVDDVLDDLCWRLLDLYDTPRTPPPAHEKDAG